MVQIQSERIEEKHRDPGTGALTKAALLSDNGVEAVREFLNGRPAACVVLDVAGVGVANEFLGRQEVDGYLKTVMGQLKSVLSDALVTRWGGDEFLVIVPLDDNNTEAALVEKIHKIEQLEYRLDPEKVAAGVVSAEDLERAQMMSALKTHEKQLAKQFKSAGSNESLEAYQAYTNNSEKHECVASPKLLKFYLGSWEHLGDGLDQAAIIEAARESEERLNLVKAGARGVEHFSGRPESDFTTEIFNFRDISERLDMALSNLEGGREVFRLGSVQELPITEIKADGQLESCLLLNVSHFGAINNNFSPEEADQMLAAVVGRVFESYTGEECPVLLRTAGGEVMVLANQSLTESQLRVLGANVLEEVRRLVDPSEGNVDAFKQSQGALINAAMQNEVRELQNLLQGGKPLVAHGLGDVFISQISGARVFERDQLTGDVVSDLKELLHQNPGGIILEARPGEKAVLFPEFHASS